MPFDRMQFAYDYPLAEQRFSALRDGCDESFIFYQRDADPRNLVLRTPFARRSKELQQNENDSPGRVSADPRLVGKPHGIGNSMEISYRNYQGSKLRF